MRMTMSKIFSGRTCTRGRSLNFFLPFNTLLIFVLRFTMPLTISLYVSLSVYLLLWTFSIIGMKINNSKEYQEQKNETFLVLRSILPFLLLTIHISLSVYNAQEFYIGSFIYSLSCIFCPSFLSFTYSDVQNYA